MSNCMCPKGCPQPKLAPHNFCGRSCGNGTCTHLPSPSHLPQAAAPAAPAPAAAAAASGGTKCACNGCNNTVFPPHPFCSRKCGTNACGHAPSSPAVPVAAAAPAFTGPKCSCNGCNSPALAPHPFCSRKCGTNACGHSSSSSSSSSAPAPAVASGPSCACPGCTAAALPSFTFCSKKCGTGTCGHVALGPACRCPLCPNPTRPNPKNPGSFTDFCSTNCSSKACGHPHKPGLIRKLSQTDPIKFNEIKQQFASKWLSTTIPCPTVREIYSVDLSNKKSKFDAYQRMIIAKRPHLAKATAKAGPGNTRRRFHGTNQNCLLGIATMDPCSRSDCSVCLILKSGGLTTAKAKSQTGWGRYGCGIYTTSTSSKANDYSRGAVDAIFMAEVVVGDTFKLMSDDPTLTQPPGGKDSVVAEVSGVNASDELIVYNDDACILKYLVHYC